MVKEFETKLQQNEHGPVVTIKQIDGISYNIWGGPQAEAIEYTPHEAEQFVKELTNVIKQARNIINSKARI